MNRLQELVLTAGCESLSVCCVPKVTEFHLKCNDRCRELPFIFRL